MIKLEVCVSPTSIAYVMGVLTLAKRARNRGERPISAFRDLNLAKTSSRNTVWRSLRRDWL
jgi:hypothetical protein